MGTADTVTLTGIILKTSPVGERDRRVVLLSKERGKISAFAKGARRQDSQLLGTVQQFSFGSFRVIAGRGSYYQIIGAEIQNYFTELRDDLVKICYGTYFCELADYYTRENLPAMEMMKLLYQSLRALSVPSLPMRLVRYIYELRMIQLNGEAPQVFHCVKCGSEEHLHVFSCREGGLLCADCQAGHPDSLPVSDSAVYTMQFILATPIEKLYTFTVAEDVLEELRQVMGHYYDMYVDAKFKSLEMLEGME